ncbi:hypothetical protein FB451DRAFT_1574209 [Mycena latifolia]|nr:hypothetical protein FB451DRAFT_1574209 [Mycena latifolia]
MRARCRTLLGTSCVISLFPSHSLPHSFSLARFSSPPSPLPSRFTRLPCHSILLSFPFLFAICPPSPPPYVRSICVPSRA